MIREWSGDPPRGPGVVGRPSWRSGSGQEAFPEAWVALPNVQEWLGGPYKGQGVVVRPS